jgi:hypothetical protein
LIGLSVQDPDTVVWASDFNVETCRTLISLSIPIGPIGSAYEWT